MASIQIAVVAACTILCELEFELLVSNDDAGVKYRDYQPEFVRRIGTRINVQSCRNGLKSQRLTFSN